MLPAWFLGLEKFGSEEDCGACRFFLAPAKESKSVHRVSLEAGGILDFRVGVPGVSVVATVGVGEDWPACRSFMEGVGRFFICKVVDKNR